MGGSGRYPGTSIESSMWSGRYQVLQKYPEPDPEPGYLGSGRHRVAKPGHHPSGSKDFPCFRREDEIIRIHNIIQFLYDAHTNWR